MITLVGCFVNFQTTVYLDITKRWHPPTNQGVVGSNPASRAKFLKKPHLRMGLFYFEYTCHGNSTPLTSQPRLALANFWLKGQIMNHPALTIFEAQFVGELKLMCYIALHS